MPPPFSACRWYLIVYLMDCTLGISLAIAFHRLMHRATRWRHNQIMASKDRCGGGGAAA